MSYYGKAVARKIESDRQLGIYLENAAHGVSDTAKHTVEQAGMGFDRSVR